MSINKFTILAVAASLTLPMMASSASAGGFLADVFIRPWSPQAADLADDVHRDLHGPLNSIPGELARRLPGGQFVGDYCETPIGVFGPGPLRPLGAPCHARGYRGFVVD